MVERSYSAQISKPFNLSLLEGHQLSQAIDSVKRALEHCSEDERREIRSLFDPSVQKHPLEVEWEIDSKAILDAINRASDITRRGVRGIIAEAIFERDALPPVLKLGWEPVEEVGNDPLYDSVLQLGDRKVRIQIKLQRLEKQKPKRFYPKHYDEELYDVEVQKTRTGKRKKKLTVESSTSDALIEVIEELEDTRPYKFTDFDILAVNMHPSTRNWSSFRYTVASWLIPRPKNDTLIEIHQPVAMQPNDVWTDDLATCLGWFLKDEKKRVLNDVKHVKAPRKPAKRKERVAHL